MKERLGCGRCCVVRCGQVSTVLNAAKVCDLKRGPCGQIAKEKSRADAEVESKEMGPATTPILPIEIERTNEDSFSLRFSALASLPYSFLKSVAHTDDTAWEFPAFPRSAPILLRLGWRELNDR